MTEVEQFEPVYGGVYKIEGTDPAVYDIPIVRVGDSVVYVQMLGRTTMPNLTWPVEISEASENWVRVYRDDVPEWVLEDWRHVVTTVRLDLDA